MTPKEKAQELVEKMYRAHSGSASAITMYFAKQCALIAVDEILNLEPPELSYMEPFSNSWWQEVKLEIEKL